MDDAIQAQYTAFEQCVAAWMHEEGERCLAFELAKVESAAEVVEITEEQAARLAAARTPLEAAILSAGWTQQQAADFVGVSQPTMYRYVSGQATMPVGRAKLLAERLGIDYQILVDSAVIPDATGSREGTLQGFILYGLILSGWPGKTPHDVAESVGLTPHELGRWVQGDMEIAVATAEEMVRTWLPGRLEEFGLG